MAVQHQFIFQPGRWVGEGRITFSSSPQHLHFYTSWWIEPSDAALEIFCLQRVEMQTPGEALSNQFLINQVRADTFTIRLENELLGSIQGRGVVDARTIAWEFRKNAALEGFEVYELQENGDYRLHAEYASEEQLQTIIDGRIWKKADAFKNS